MKTLVSLILLFPSIAFAQRNWESVKINVHPITDHIAYLVGRGGNVGVIHGEDGVLIIDNQFAPLSEKITTAVGTLSSGNIAYVINTHYHGDHTGGNQNFKSSGATIVAQEQVRERLGTTFQNEALDREMVAKPESFWPSVTFVKDSTFRFNGEEIELIHIPAAHTDGDAIVHFKSSNVIHAGDCFVRYGYPYIDISAGGSIDGMIAAQEILLELANEETRIIPGHGEQATASEVKELLEMLRSTKKIVADARSAGESLAALIDRKPLAAYHERWNGSFINSDLFVRLIYESLPEE